MSFYLRMKHFLQVPAKKKLLIGMNCYQSLSGCWVTSHGAVILSYEDYLTMSLDDVKELF